MTNGTQSLTELNDVTLLSFSSLSRAELQQTTQALAEAQKQAAQPQGIPPQAKAEIDKLQTKIAAMLVDSQKLEAENKTLKTNLEKKVEGAGAGAATELQAAKVQISTLSTQNKKLQDEATKAKALQEQVQVSGEIQMFEANDA